MVHHIVADVLEVMPLNTQMHCIQNILIRNNQSEQRYKEGHAFTLFCCDWLNSFRDPACQICFNGIGVFFPANWFRRLFVNLVHVTSVSCVIIISSNVTRT